LARTGEQSVKHPRTELHRRAFLLAALPLLAGAATPRDTVLRRAGFVVDLAPVADLPDQPQIVTALERQIDITAGCGAKTEIATFFRNQRITAVHSTGRGGGLFTAPRGVEIDTVPLPPPDNPILLHELIHAMHRGYMGGGNANPDIAHFYQLALQGDLYPQARYMMSNHREFFAISGSLYLWGVIARPPYRREILRARQPTYYDWLGEVFGVKK
jgi:hypothetical protein